MVKKPGDYRWFQNSDKPRVSEKNQRLVSQSYPQAQFGSSCEEVLFSGLGSMAFKK